MNKNILFKGLLAGIIVSATLAISVVVCYDNQSFASGMITGYTSMAISFIFVFLGVKQERDNNNGLLSFGKAFKTGILISFIASTLYVLTWLVDYYVFVPDFMERYTEFTLKEAAEKGQSAAELAEMNAEMAKYRDMYQNPFWVVILTYLEIFPVGLVMSLVAALVFKRKQKKETV